MRVTVPGSLTRREMRINLDENRNKECVTSSSYTSTLHHPLDLRVPKKDGEAEVTNGASLW